MSEGSNPYESPKQRPPGFDQFQPAATPEIAGKVSGPATGLMVTAGVGIALQILGLAMNLLGVGLGAAGAQQNQEMAMQMMSGGIAIFSSLIGIGIGVVIWIGAAKMKNLESYGFAMTSTILAMLPCVSPCCVIGLPIGIWSLVVLLDEQVKSAFH